MKRIAVITAAGASVFSVVALQRRGVLPRLHVDTAKAREAVTITRNGGGKHEQSEIAPDADITVGGRLYE